MSNFYGSLFTLIRIEAVSMASMHHGNVVVSCLQCHQGLSLLLLGLLQLVQRCRLAHIHRQVCFSIFNTLVSLIDYFT